MADAQSRDQILELATRAKQAFHTPSTFMTELLVQQQQYACLRWLCHFDMLTRIPVSGPGVSYDELASACGVPESSLRAVSRMVMTMGFLHEPSEGLVAHNGLSASFVEDPHLMTWLLHMVNHTVPFMEAFSRATERFGATKRPNETAFNIAFDTDLAYFAYLKSRPDLEREFDAYMQSQSRLGGARVEYLLEAFDWASVSLHAGDDDGDDDGAQQAVVKNGGGSGNTSLTVARVFKTLRFVIQDQATPIANARRRKAEAEAADEEDEEAWRRIELQEHNFFDPQPIIGAGVYILCMIIHDWDDEQAVQILQRLARAMGPQSRILIMDMVIPAPGSTSILSEAALREKDLCMRQVFNAKEREMKEWYDLIAKVTPPLRIEAIKRRDGSQHSVMEVVLDKHEKLTNGR